MSREERVVTRGPVARVLCRYLSVLVVLMVSDPLLAQVSVVVYPPDVTLETMRDAQRVMVVATDADGVNLDVTDESTLTLDHSIARIEGNTLKPVSDGSTVLHASFNGETFSIPVSVVNSGVERPISFRLDVMPVFMATGCNSGTCHGSARGQDGFRLSLFGFDPGGDYHRITRELDGRRINLARPDESLLVEKALGKVVHTGGRRFEEDSHYFETLTRWIEAGVPRDSEDVARVTDVQVYPPRAVMSGDGRTARMVVRAKYSDGSDRDVTDLAVFRSNNDSSLVVERGGLLTTRQRGEAFVTASFDTMTVGSPFIILPPGDEQITPSSAYTAVNYVDDHINRKLRDMRIVPSALCDDRIFVRRVYLDLAGLLPTEEEARQFLEDTSADKRATLIDQLLERREFIDLWVMEWAEILQIRSNNEISYKAALQYFEWLRNSFTNGVSLDELTRRILTAEGGTFTSPQTNFYLNQNDTLVLAENVAQAFMGIRIQCAQCHNHPFDRWTQNDYYGFVSFFTQVGRKQAEDPRERIIFNRGGGEYNHPVTGQPLEPKFLGGQTPDVRGKDRRAVVADWLTSPENPWFARSIANRVWAHFMGVGIVEPVDDFRISNPASNDALLKSLGERLVAVNYDLKAIVRDICNSHAYQRSTQTNETNASDDRNFSHALVRRLRAETLLDIVCQVTEQPEKFRGLPLGARAVEIADGSTSSYFLTTFGRAARESVCACEVVREPSLSQALHLLNGPTVHAKVVNGSVINRMLDTGMSPASVIDALYERCFTRTPSTEERQALLSTIGPDEHQRDALNDVFWAILNAKEFVFNH